MKTTLVPFPDPEADRLPAAIGLIALALIRSRLANNLDRGALQSVYADVHHDAAEARS